jgi:hypothetical protein
VAQQLGLFFVPARRHSATPIFAASTFCVILSPARAHQRYHPHAKTLGKAKRALHVLAYNLTRVMNIMGPGRLIAAMQT